VYDLPDLVPEAQPQRGTEAVAVKKNKEPAERRYQREEQKGVTVHRARTYSVTLPFDSFCGIYSHPRHTIFSPSSVEDSRKLVCALREAADLLERDLGCP
jgi:hypothetical protein